MQQVQKDAAHAFWNGYDYMKNNIEVFSKPDEGTASMYLRTKEIARRKNGWCWVDTHGFRTKTTIGLLNHVLHRVGHKIYENGSELLIDELDWDGLFITLDEIEAFDAKPIIERARLGQIVELPEVMTTERFVAAAEKAGETFRIVKHDTIRYVGYDNGFQQALFRNPRLFADYVFVLSRSQQLVDIKHMYQLPNELSGNSICSVSINSAGTLLFECGGCTLSSQPTESVNFPAVINVLLLASGEAFTLL